MSGFYWNIRRFNKKKKHTVVKDWINKGCMKFGCLIETRVKENRAERIVSSVFRNWSTISNYENHRLGRIWVIWSPEVRVTPCFKSNQLITCSVLLEGMEEEFFCWFFYASNFLRKEESFGMI